MSRAKTDEPIEFHFGCGLGWAKGTILWGGQADLPGERAILGRLCDAAFRQNSLTTLYNVCLSGCTRAA